MAVTYTIPVNTTIQDVLDKYESLLEEGDRLFQDYVRTHSMKLTCGTACSKCCDYYFPLHFIEAYYFQKGIQSLDYTKRQAIRRRAIRNIPKIERFERIARAIEERSGGVVRDAVEPLRFLLLGKIRCPFVEEETGCMVYRYRPLIARLFGVPLRIWGDEERPLWCGLNTTYPITLPTLDACWLLEEVARLSRSLELLLTGRTSTAQLRFIWFTALFPLESFIEGGKVMKEEELTPEQQRLKLRRRLLKLGVYSVPAIATVLATEAVYAQGTGKRANVHQNKAAGGSLS
ncbi:MAG TPA: YkgJ family cysteine cluster protein [Candidatus Tripitaka californicus]|uniref:YkgJ family cysteine cluster protein n=1 Tax=Candidatus Tripitaka californicus TaxID=3367616 RepID=UPI0040293BA9|nr:YkgJ family cysteine cluster protein [Planctomycetota bacterium]